jgi:Leucine-rich repeat (LRR) protein
MCSNNRIRRVPPSIGLLRRLRVLALASNLLEEFPRAEILSLPLESLNPVTKDLAIGPLHSPQDIRALLLRLAPLKEVGFP